jgi:hypothetical protein
MRYLVKFKTERLTNIESIADRDDVYIAPEGDRGWAILEVEDGESSHRDLLEALRQEAEETQPVLLGREYVAIVDARKDLEDSKARFVDDPSGALAEARRAVSRALEARDYPSSSEDAGQTSNSSHQEILQEYESTDVGQSGNIEEMRDAFNRLSDILERLARP